MDPATKTAVSEKTEKAVNDRKKPVLSEKAVKALQEGKEGQSDEIDQ